MSVPENELRPIDITDERDPLAREAVRLIRESIGDVQSTADLLSELEERRRGLSSGGDYHLMGLVAPDGRLMAAAAGVYLEASNAGFITYLAVRSDQRGNELGRELRAHLVDALGQSWRGSWGRCAGRAAGSAPSSAAAGRSRSS
jgi:ribosomal protein S18 acetylase RimI-like enzyme